MAVARARPQQLAMASADTRSQVRRQSRLFSAPAAAPSRRLAPTKTVLAVTPGQHDPAGGFYYLAPPQLCPAGRRCCFASSVIRCASNRALRAMPFRGSSCGASTLAPPTSRHITLSHSSVVSGARRSRARTTHKQSRCSSGNPSETERDSPNLSLNSPLPVQCYTAGFFPLMLRNAQPSSSILQ